MIHKCEICNYETKYKSHMRDHLESEKHKIEQKFENEYHIQVIDGSDALTFEEKDNGQWEN